MKIKKLNTLFTAIIIFALLSACSHKSANIKTTHQSKNLSKTNSILVLSVGEQRSSQTFEMRIARRLSDNQLTAYSFRDKNKASGEINEAKVVETLKQLNADAVLVTQLTNLKVIAGLKEGRKEIVRTPSNQGIFGVFQQYDFSRVQNPDVVELGAHVMVSAELYSAQDGELLWSGEVKTSNVDDPDMALIEMSQLISSKIISRIR